MYRFQKYFYFNHYYLCIRARYSINASWEAVKLVNKEELEKKHNVQVVLLEIPVTYDHVDELVPALWKTHTPILMLHAGVSYMAKELTLEMQAYKNGYKGKDFFDKCPADYTCPAGDAFVLHTKLDVEKICKNYNEVKVAETTTVASKDAGRYLCEYIYYTSLSMDNMRTLFVHVPEIDVYPSERAARGLEHIVELCLQQIREMDTC
ncbi:pyroglutamyl-peptidase 1-like isoform X2 [Epargyreus clarus]|uniref:pyroglutamyl-peptidase 1-like isoform X2 n=1 Tax=Epargyreus clarus TaxID=520877 RepID=UPI003C2DA28E